jgi:hypothetical protein
MSAFFFLLLRLICYVTLAVVLAASVALIVISVNGQCPPITSIGVTCIGRNSQRLADFGLTVMGFTLDTGFPIVLAVGGVIFLMRDIRSRRA